MAKIAVVFRSRYGASKDYALMLGKKLAAEVVENEGLTPLLLEPFDSIILIGGVYATKISGLELFSKYLQDFSDKELAVFAVGLNPDSADNIAALRKHNFRGKLERVPLFYGRGSFDEESLSFVDRNIVMLLRKTAEKKKAEKRTELENEMLGIRDTVSWVDEHYLDPVIDMFRSF